MVTQSTTSVPNTNQHFFTISPTSKLNLAIKGILELIVLSETRKHRAHVAYRPYPHNRAVHLPPRINTLNRHFPALDNMNQSDTNNSTEEYPAQSPQEFRLRRTNDGWTGKHENFRVVNNVIKIKYSDADENIAPTEQQRRKMYDASGNYSQHKQLFQEDHVFQLWMSKIGPYLADWVLNKRNDGAWLFFFFLFFFQSL